MSTIINRNTKGSALTFTEMDNNFANLNTDKLENITGQVIGSLSNVTITSVGDNELLQYDNGTSQWINQTLGEAGVLALTGLSVGAESAASGDGAIAYDNSTGVFTYTPPTAAGIGAATSAQGTTADSALQNVSEDASPQLGADLDLNSNDITGTGAISITGAVTAQSAFNAQTGASYTTVLTDASKLVTLSNGSANTITIPPNSSVAYAVGTKIDIAQIGAGQTTVAAGAGVTVNSTPTLKLRAQYSGATCIKTATDTWLLVGDLAAT